MIEIKNYSGVDMKSDITEVTADTPKGGFEITVGSASKIKAGDWVCLYVKNNDPGICCQRNSPPPHQRFERCNFNRERWSGIYDLHQVASVNGNKVTFKEPIMHEVEAKYNWVIKEYKHYENVGVEDIRF
mgnify:CR=1 FL=1